MHLALASLQEPGEACFSRPSSDAQQFADGMAFSLLESEYTSVLSPGPPGAPWVNLSELLTFSEPPGHSSTKQGDATRRAGRSEGQGNSRMPQPALRSLCLMGPVQPPPTSSLHFFFIPSPHPPAHLFFVPWLQIHCLFLKLIQYFLMSSFIFPIGFLVIPPFIVCFGSTPGPTRGLLCQSWTARHVLTVPPL